MYKLNSVTSCVALLAAFCSLSVQGLRADVTATLDVDLAKRGPAIPPTFGGLMTEEINFSYDGGLYAELIQNRTFQDPAPPGNRLPTPGPFSEVAPHWTLVGSEGGGASLALDTTDPVNATALPKSLKLTVPTGSSGRVGIANDGLW